MRRQPYDRQVAGRTKAYIRQIRHPRLVAKIATLLNIVKQPGSLVNRTSFSPVWLAPGQCPVHHPPPDSHRNLTRPRVQRGSVCDRLKSPTAPGKRGSPTGVAIARVPPTMKRNTGSPAETRRSPKTGRPTEWCEPAGRPDHFARQESAPSGQK